MKDVDAVRKLLQWEQMRMKKQFEADMRHFIPRIIGLAVLATLAIWGDRYLTRRFIHEAETKKITGARAQEADSERGKEDVQAR